MASKVWLKGAERPLSQEELLLLLLLLMMSPSSSSSSRAASQLAWWRQWETDPPLRRGRCPPTDPFWAGWAGRVPPAPSRGATALSATWRERDDALEGTTVRSTLRCASDVFLRCNLALRPPGAPGWDLDRKNTPLLHREVRRPVVKR